MICSFKKLQICPFYGLLKKVILTSSPKHGDGAHPITESSAATIQPLPLQPIDLMFQPDKSEIGFGYMLASFDVVYWPHIYTVPGHSEMARLNWPPATIFLIPLRGPSKNFISLGTCSSPVCECPRRPYPPNPHENARFFSSVNIYNETSICLS